MEKIYIPNEDDLHNLRSFMSGDTLYLYLYLKTVEKAITSSKKGKILKSISSDLAEDPNIYKPICKVFPEEIKNSAFASYDPDLAINIISMSEREKSSIDNVRYFNEKSISSILFLRKFITHLGDELLENDMYRFRHTDSHFIDGIFARQISPMDFSMLSMMPEEDIIKSLLRIEPCYALDIPKQKYMQVLYFNMLKDIIISRAKYYWMDISKGSEYFDKDIIKNPDENVKKLVRYICK